MTDDELTNSLLNEYSIADILIENAEGGEIHVEGIRHESLRDAFSRYAKVIFHDIADSYPIDADVQCFFSLTLDMKCKDGDVVGLFRLGWHSPSEMITSQIVPKPTNDDQRDFQVQFQAADLPKDEGEIYQLCYISDNEVWGASVPFEFKRPPAGELLVVDSGDIIVVRSQSALAEDLKSQLGSIRRELSAAEANNVETGKKLVELQEENQLLKGRLKDLEKVELVLDRLRNDYHALDMARNESEDALRKSNLHIVTQESIILSLRKDVDNFHDLLKTQSEEMTKQQALALSATNQRGCSQDLIDALREGKELAVREMRAALAENDKMKHELTDAAEEKAVLLQQIDDLSKKYHDILQTLEGCETAHKKRIEDLLVQLTRLTSESQQRLNEAKAETQVLQKHVTTLQAELEDSKEKVKILNAQVGSLSLQPEEAQSKKHMDEETSEELKVLQDRLEDVRTRYGEVHKEMDNLHVDMKTLQQTESSLVESQRSLEQRVNCLESRMRESEYHKNKMETSMHRRELDVARAKLQEKTICLESAQQHRDELEKQMKELEEESSVLNQQEIETRIAKENIMRRMNENSDPVSVGGINQEKLDTQGAADVCNRQVYAEVADLRERLFQAAEAYKQLYREKLQLEKELARDIRTMNHK